MRFILGVLLAGVAFFMWGFVYWTVSPLPKQIIQPVDGQVTAALQNAKLETGAYKYPAPAEVEDEAAFTEQMESGPLYMLFYRSTGGDMKTQLIYGFLHSLGLALIGALIIMAASPRTYINRVMLIVWVAVFGSFWAEFGNVIWWNYPMNYCWLEMGYHLGGGLILGIILAGFVRPDPEMA